MSHLATPARSMCHLSTCLIMTFCSSLFFPIAKAENLQLTDIERSFSTVACSQPFFLRPGAFEGCATSAISWPWMAKMFVKITTTLSAWLMDVDYQRSGTGYLIARTIFRSGDWTANDSMIVLQKNLRMASLLLRRWGQSLWTGWSSELAEPVKEDSDGSDLGFNFL